MPRDALTLASYVLAVSTLRRYQSPDEDSARWEGFALRPDDPGIRLIATGSYLAVGRRDAARVAYDAFRRLNQHRPLQ